MRKFRKKFKRPRRPWDSDRIEEESRILKEFGLRKKMELRNAESTVRDFRRRARDLIAVKDEEKTKVLIDKLVKLGLLKKGADLEDVLKLKAEDLLGRRIQTIVMKKGGASTMKHARQKVTHGHVYIKDRKVSFPSYIVPMEQEKMVEIKGGKK